MAVDWDFYDPDYLRLVEVFQAARGSYEHDGCFRQYDDAVAADAMVIDGLRRGYRFGLIASSDHGHGASYVGAYSPDLSRASIFSALHQRRAIASTARDINVDFRVGGSFIGEESTVRSPAHIEANVSAYADVARVDVVREGRIVRSLQPTLGMPTGWIAVGLRIEWGRSRGTVDWSGQASVQGGEFLRTAYYAPAITEVEPSRIAWRARTEFRGDLHGLSRGGIEATAIGPRDAIVEVVTEFGRLHTRIGDLADGRSSKMNAPAGGTVSVQPGTGGLSSLGSRRVDLAFDDPLDSPTWYYLRVFLVDGEMAWTSPIWVSPDR